MVPGCIRLYCWYFCLMWVAYVELAFTVKFVHLKKKYIILKSLPVWTINKDFCIIFQNRPVAFLVGPYIQWVIHAFYAWNFIPVDNPIGIKQFTLKSPMWAKDNVGSCSKCFERKFYELHICKHIVFSMLFLTIPVFIFGAKMFKYITCFDKRCALTLLV